MIDAIAKEAQVGNQRRTDDCLDAAPFSSGAGGCPMSVDTPPASVSPGGSSGKGLLDFFRHREVDPLMPMSSPRADDV